MLEPWLAGHHGALPAVVSLASATSLAAARVISALLGGLHEEASLSTRVVFCMAPKACLGSEAVPLGSDRQEGEPHRLRMQQAGGFAEK